MFIVPDAVKVYKHFKSQDVNIQNKVRNYTFFVFKIILKTFRCDLKSTRVIIFPFYKHQWRKDIKNTFWRLVITQRAKCQGSI